MSALNWIAFAMTLVATGGIMLRRDWRWNVGFLALQFLGVFWLIQISWNISLAAVKLVTGWIVCAVLALARRNAVVEQEDESNWPQGGFFRLAAIGLIVVVTFTGGLGLSAWLGMSMPGAWGGLLLIGTGLLHLGVTGQSFRLVLGLVTALSGFEIIYAAVESSALVTGLLAVINLGLALVGAYLLPRLEETEAS